MAALKDELAQLQGQISRAGDVATQALLHREATYVALDIGDTGAALSHALSCLELARASHDLPLQVKAHVTLAIVQAEGYDDLGAAEQFRAAEKLAEQAGDHRGVALVVINAAHYLMERGQYLEAATRLHDLWHSPHVDALDLPESVELRQAFHINYVVSATEVLMPEASTDHDVLKPRLAESAGELRRLNAHRGNLTNALRTLDVLDALMRHALCEGDLTASRQLADEFVHLSSGVGSGTMSGRALFSRSRLMARMGQWAEAIDDAQAATAHFARDHQDLWVIRCREALADAYAHTRRYHEAFEMQRAVTRQVESLYRQNQQQRALLGQITQQAREADVRAAAFAEAALQDALTGIPNRAYAMQLLTDLHTQAPHAASIAVALLDLDHFKQVNDTWGHATGDLVLSRVAQTLRAEVRAGDSVARFGGEEFVVILTGVTLAEAQESCERLRRSLTGLDWNGFAPGLHTSGSFGVALLDRQRDLKATLLAADTALYQAKAAGRNQVRAVSEPVQR
ncbi:hypothetical protein GCM10008955_33240 [Deinococcus malanensis]|uniref:GGDEF domain-containing protein n=2 Tax=Deinococcus malanensis TaxID=1706855 RepID=A0ABQ2F319_9DEIO|nr:hypothetical protein GCM10008955_33240 [Deinococcus malanensis]